jgi:cation transport protein ChaC
MKQFWIFGYGSLMWRPGFEFSRKEPALIRGYHRRLCVYSHVHRGTPERPGLVLGLDRGGSCRGVAFMVEPHGWSATLDYLRRREQVTSVYFERRMVIELTATGEKAEAVTYVVDRKHKQYAGVLPLGPLIEYVRQGQGVSGHCTEYVRNTLQHLREMKIGDSTLEAVAAKLQDQAASKIA